MGLLKREAEVAGDKTTARLEVLFDTGARSSVIKTEVAEKLASVLPLREVKDFGTAKQGTRLQAKVLVVLEIQINGHFLDGKFYVVEKLSRDIIVGVDFMQNWAISLDLRNETITVGVDPHNIELF